MAFVEEHWDEPDEGLWEVRGPRRHFIHSKVMCWVALDRAVRQVEEFGRTRPGRNAGGRCATRSTPRSAHKGFDPARGTFTQSYGSRELDAALLLIPMVGFLPPDDPRVIGTVEAIQRELMADGLRAALPGGRATTTSTACRAARARSSRAASGWPRPWP